ncbi:MAG TPA: hypothetical protein VIR45_12405, partial [Kiloniellaceae bacterium]
MALPAGKRAFVVVVILHLVMASLTGAATAWAAEALSEADRQRYTSALTLLQDGHVDRGLALARQGSHPLANKIVAWFYLGRRDSDAGFSEISAFLEANPDWPGLFGLYRNAELKLPQTLSPSEVLAWFGDRQAITGTGALRHVAALWDSGQQERAREAARQYWVDADFDSREESAFHRHFKSLLRDEDELARLDRLLWDQRSADARRQLQRVPSGAAALARARLALLDDQPGVDALIERVPAALRDDPGLTYARAVWRQRRGRFEGVVELLDSLPPQFPQTTAWWRLRNWAVWRGLDRKDYDLA